MNRSRASTRAEPSGGIDPDEPAAAATRPDALAPGTRLNELRVERVIGASGFGIVYLAKEEATAHQVAVKEYLPDTLAVRGDDGVQVLLRSPDHADAFERGRRAFVDEAECFARCRHPSLLRVLGHWETHGTVCRAMPFYPGRTLLALRRAMPTPPDEATLRDLLDGLLGALEALHASGALHGSIVPGNILLLPDDRPLLLDTDAVQRAVLGDETRALMTWLQPCFAPVEQIAPSPERAPGPWTDLYALAAVLRYCITGKLPPPPSPQGMPAPLPMATQVRRLQERHPLVHYSAALLTAIDAALAHDPGDRPRSVAEWRALLNDRSQVPAQHAAPLFDDAGEIPPGDAGDTSTEAAPGATVEGVEDVAARVGERDSAGADEGAPVVPADAGDRAPMAPAASRCGAGVPPSLDAPGAVPAPGEHAAAAAAGSPITPITAVTSSTPPVDAQSAPATPVAPGMPPRSAQRSEPSDESSPTTPIGPVISASGSVPRTPVAPATPVTRVMPPASPAQPTPAAPVAPRAGGWGAPERREPVLGAPTPMGATGSSSGVVPTAGPVLPPAGAARPPAGAAAVPPAGAVPPTGAARPPTGAARPPAEAAVPPAGAAMPPSAGPVPPGSAAKPAAGTPRRNLWSRSDRPVPSLGFAESARRRRQRFAAAGVALLVLMAGGGAWVIEQQRHSQAESAFAEAARQDGLTANAPTVPRPADDAASAAAATATESATATSAATAATTAAAPTALVVDRTTPQAATSTSGTGEPAADAASAAGAAPDSVKSAAPTRGSTATAAKRTPPRSSSSARSTSGSGSTRVAATPTSERATSPRAACGNRTQFALYRCMQQQCAQPQWSQHAACKRLRTRDEVPS